MSARPRPVTATFKPKSMDPPVGVRPRNYSLSSANGSSTVSLLSVLDHSSYVHLSGSVIDNNSSDSIQESIHSADTSMPNSHLNSIVAADGSTESLISILKHSSVKGCSEANSSENTCEPARKRLVFNKDPAKDKSITSSLSELSVGSLDQFQSVTEISPQCYNVRPGCSVPCKPVDGVTLENSVCDWPLQKHELVSDVSPQILNPPKYEERHHTQIVNKVRFLKRGSTESLVSVLDHDSCDDLRLSDSEPEEAPSPIQQQHSEPVKKKRYRRHTHESVENGMRRHKACKEPIDPQQKGPTSHRERPVDADETSDTYIVDSTEHDGRLTPWEQWVLRKAKEDQVKVQKEIDRKKKEKELLQKKQEEKRLRDQKNKAKYEEWLEQRVDKLSVQAKQQKKQEKRKSKIKEEEKQRIEEKSEKKYEEWLCQKKIKEEEQKQKEKEEKERKKREKEELKEKCDQAYIDWLNKINTRPKSAPQRTSFGYASGKLTGYYDSSAYPVPSFYNPLPWQPVALPKAKPEKRKPAKTNKKWNPNKYL